MLELRGVPMRADKLVDSYLRRTSLAREAAVQDGQFSMQIKWLRDVLHMLDIAMEDEGVPPETRERVLRVALYGSLENPMDALDRERATAARIEQMKSIVPRHWPLG